MYLAPHVKTLYSQIRNRALIQVRHTAYTLTVHRIIKLLLILWGGEQNRVYK